MKIGFFEIEDWEKTILEKKLKSHKLFFSKEPLSDPEDYEIISPFIYSIIDKKVLSKASKLKYIATRSTGFDHIDLKEAKKRGVLVSNVPYYGDNTVAEHTFALLLALSRKLYPSIERTKKGDFSLEGLRGFDLEGKTIGIIGLGHIGICVARIAKGFGMNIIAFDVKKDNRLAKELGLKHVSFNDLLKKSDVITLHAPYNKKTHHLINKDNIKLIKKGAYLINTARGGLVETEALAQALDQKIIAGAGLDVLEEECFIKEERELLSKEFPKTCDLKTVLRNHILINQDNVVMTPHSAFNSKEALGRILETTVENIDSFINKKPINLV